jgi:hypothetical protein
VHLNQHGWAGKPDPEKHRAVPYTGLWDGKTWWVGEGTGRKSVDKSHDRDHRKVYVRDAGIFVKGWTNKLVD